MNRRLFLTSAAAVGFVAGSVPATAAHDPLLELIREYQTQMAIYNASGDLTDAEDNALAEVTWHASYDRLCEAPPAATTQAGALAAVEFVRDEVEGCGYQPELFVNVLNAAAAYLQGSVS